ncbi:chemotaxis protein CheB [Actinoplanes sp. NPDC023714]|uniref:chemotaxis protein CheB n=1 Tax=Actinoplanes sp. NPDC023714 TaxID=3154322 RepID=UPI0033E43EE8
MALACSAGGLPALQQITSGLATDSPAAFIVLRHQDPRYGDHLAGILQRRTRMPVAFAHDGDVLVPGRILVAPPGYHTLVSRDFTVVLVRSGDRPPYRPSADLLFTSMAIAAAGKAIAVVLSGYGNDGATGAAVIHHLGGTVIAGDKSTSPVFAMPNAAISRDEIVDHVVPVNTIARLLTTLFASGPSESVAAAAPR